MKYISYSPLLGLIARRGLRAIPTKTLRELIGVKGAVTPFMQAHPHIFEIMDGAILTDEWYWLTNGRPMIFPESIETLTNIQRGKFRVEAAEGIEPPYPCFVINMPKGFLIHGSQCPAIMVTIWDKQSRLHDFSKPFISAMGMELSVNSDDFRTPGLRTERSFSINYHVEERGRDGERMVARCLMGWDTLACALAAHSATEYQDLIGNFPEAFSPGSVWKLNEKEAEQQFSIVQLVARMMVYMQATDALRDGFPANGHDDVTPQYWDEKGKHATAKTFHVSHHKQHVSPQAHYRSFTIRQLRDDRYYKGEHAHKTKGSRFVFVKDTYVGADVEASTLIHNH